jgi:integrase
VPLASPAVHCLLEHAGDDARSGPVFLAQDGRPLSASTLDKAWQRIRKRAGIADARLHDLRHTVGTYAGSAGLNAFLVRDLLGHKTLAMTGRYVERNVDPLRAAAEAISSRIAAAMAGQVAEVVPLAPTVKHA